MSQKRVQLDADEQNRHFREAKNSRGEDEAQDDDSGDGSVDEDRIVHRGIPHGDEPQSPDGDFLADFDENTEVHIRFGLSSASTILPPNLIPKIRALEALTSLVDLDLYDNRCSKIEGLENLTELRSLDLSFNDNRHIKNVAHLVNLPDLYFVSNKITVIENLSTLVNITNLELGSNQSGLSCESGATVARKDKITKLELKILSIQSNRLTAIEGLEDLENLEIYLSHNGISRIEGLERNISKLENLGHLKNLEELWASNNMLDSFEDFEAELKDNCLDLATVYAECEGLLGPDHAPEARSDGEAGSLGGDHAHQSKEGHPAPERERAMSEDGEISRSTGAISNGSARDTLIFAERLQMVIGYPESEEVIGGNEARRTSWIRKLESSQYEEPFDISVTGYWSLDNPDLSWTLPEDLVAFLKADPKSKPDYIGFGSMVDSAGVGQKTMQEEIVIPPRIYMIKSVPHDWLFPQLAGCVHHGGAGTAAAGSRAAIPTVIKPFFGDHYFWARCLEEA
ncbi:MAG: hypothetical protein J3Q66DRAFT_404671 [Benniella sp.]|nr:MAG: hypothetical protein J3Q66DRAFT_404671 [Benniella sp.]